MKKQLLLLCLFFSLLNQAQQQVVFCPPGAKWHYNFYHYNIVDYPNNPHYVGYLYNNTAEYVGDTIIDNALVKIIRHPPFDRGSCGCFATTTYIKQSGDTIFMKNTCTNYDEQLGEIFGLPGNGWQILYAFTDSVGSQWINYYAGGYSVGIYTTTVKSIQTITINATGLKQMRVAHNMYSFSGGYPSVMPDTVITERIGGSYLFPFSSGDCDGYNFNNFLCYQDSSFGLYQAGEKNCDYATYYTGVEEQSINAGVVFYPNPISTNVTIKLRPNNFYDLKISDALGLVCKEVSLVEEKTIIDVSQLKAGIYFLQVFEKGKLIGAQKVIKE